MMGNALVVGLIQRVGECLADLRPVSEKRLRLVSAARP
jgi:hypothetical protein